jgi:hypothetical protein
MCSVAIDGKEKRMRKGGGEKQSRRRRGGRRRQGSGGAAGLPSSHHGRDRGRELVEMRLGFDRPRGAVLFRPIPAEGHQITIRWSDPCVTERCRPRAAPRPGRRGSGSVYLPRRAARVQSGPWAAEGRGPKLFFQLFCLQITVFVDFAQILSKISFSFFYSNFSNEILIRDCKSYRNFSIKFKVNEFLNSCFRCK